jgi:large subunit ribosomal protein L17
MRHKKARWQLNRFTSWRKSTLTALAKNLLIQQSIKTTLHRARAAKPLIEKIISLAKLNTVAAKREAFRILQDHKLVSLAFNEIGPRFAKIQGGYTRIINLNKRRGDDARLVILELTEIKKKEAKKPKKEIKPEEEKKAEIAKEKPIEEKKPEAPVAVKEKPPITKKPTKKFLGGLRSIFKKERDSL